MRKLLKRAAITLLITSFIGTLGAAEAKRDPAKTHLIDSRAMIEDNFSGLETTPIVKAFVAWMNETQGDILIMPPTEADGLFYDLIMKGDSKEVNLDPEALLADGKIKDPWSKGCRQTFYVIRITSNHPIVRGLDGEDRQIMAFTFAGCVSKFIAVVADRMKDEEMMYTTMLHELGHMWGLPDNKSGVNSIMNGSWPGSSCITKRDLADVYEAMGKGGMEPKETGCSGRSKKD